MADDKKPTYQIQVKVYEEYNGLARSVGGSQFFATFDDYDEALAYANELAEREFKSRKESGIQ